MAITDPGAQSGGGPVSARPWRARAFGLTVEAEFDTVAFRPDPDLDGAGATHIQIVDVEALTTRWAGAATQRLGQVTLPDGTEIITVEADPDLGYRVWSHSVGEYVIAADGSEIQCAPVDVELWHWQRFLVGQVLPLAGALRGMEPLHASAVAIDGRAVAFLGSTCAGKTSVAVHCLRRGAGFLADDVLALELGTDALLAHPGTPLVGIRHAELGRLTPSERDEIGFPVTENDKEVLFRVDACAAVSPLGAVYLLARDPATPVLGFERIVDPRLLLASTFNFVHRPPDRLGALLDVCAMIDATAPAFRVSVPAAISAPELALAVETHVHTVL